MALALTLFERVFLLPSPYMCTCQVEPNVLPGTFCVCLASSCTVAAERRIESPNRAILIPVSYDRRRVFLSFLHVHQAFWAWCSNLFLQWIRGWRLQSWFAQIPTLKQLLWAHLWSFGASHLLLRILPLGTPGPCLLTVYILKYKTSRANVAQLVRARYC